MKKSILIFGVGILQQSIITRAQKMGLFTVGIDPCNNAYCKDIVNAFEVVDSQDFNKTIEIAKKYNISAIITAATDKPLVMMARVAKELNLNFYSEETAILSTDKFLMKKKFKEFEIPCADGKLISSIDELENLTFPLIIKPRDNSGSRGVKFCNNIDEARNSLKEAFDNTKKDSVLIENYIDGKEFSIESLHYNGKTKIIQFTEKKTTKFPYNVELGHIQPANIAENIKNEISRIIENIAKALKFEFCASHTELKINDKGIYIIETSPRLGGDYITSSLTPLSTGINIEDELLKISLGTEYNLPNNITNKASGIRYFNLSTGIVNFIDVDTNLILSNPNVKDFSLELNEHDEVKTITSSLNRYGHVIVSGNNREQVIDLLDAIELNIIKNVRIQQKEEKPKLVLIGCGVFTKTIIDLVISQNKYQIVGIIDPNIEVGSKFEGYTILGNDKDAVELHKKRVFDYVFLCIGYAQFALKEKLFNFYKKHNINFATIIHPSSIINESVKIEQGVAIGEGVIISENSYISENVTVCCGALIAHNSIIRKHSYISPRVAIAGFCNIGELCFLGINSTIKDHISITQNTIIGAGAVVIKNITINGTYVGSPANMIIKK